MNALADSVAALSASLPGAGLLAEQRADALAAFREHGLPNVRHENWRYTDISSLESAELTFALPDSAATPEFAALPVSADRFTFINGHLSESPEQSTAGIAALTNDWSTLSDGFPLNSEVSGHPLGRLNTAAAQHGVLIRAAAGSQSERPLLISLIHNARTPLVLQPRIVIDLEEQASVTVVLHCASDDGAAGWMNNVVEIRQAAGSRLELIQLQEHGSSLTQTSLISAALEDDASAAIGCFDLGAKLARNDIDIRLRGQGSHAEVIGAFLPMYSQHIDTQVSIDHIAAKTTSNTDFRGIAGEKSRGVLNSKVIVRPHAQKISAEQRSDNLLLAEDAEIDTKPELEIYADDVKCSHGATVGELDEQSLFYLRSRGIDDAAARALLTNAFAQTVVDQIGDDGLRNEIAARITQRLPEHERWERLT